MRTGLMGFLREATLLLISCIVTILSVFVPVMVQNRGQLEEIYLGLPIKFIVQSQIGLPIGFPDGPSFPIRRALVSPWENPTQVNFWLFLLDIAIIFTVLNILLILVKYLRMRVRFTTS